LATYRTTCGRHRAKWLLREDNNSRQYLIPESQRTVATVPSDGIAPVESSFVAAHTAAENPTCKPFSPAKRRFRHKAMAYSLKQVLALGDRLSS